MAATLRFTKMQGIGNDYVYVNGFEERVENPNDLARQISDRHFGVGSDGLVLILPSGTSDVRMRMFNSDGSEAEMCGNAIRCVGKYVHDHGIIAKDVIRVETRAGEKIVRLLFEGGYPVLANVAKRKGLPYPHVNEQGEIEADAAWWSTMQATE